MTKSAANLRFYGDLASAVYTGAKGVTMPTTPTATPDPDDFSEVGWITDDGIGFTRDTDSTEVNAYQANTALRKKTTLKTETFKFGCLEDNLVTLGLVYPGADIATALGVTTIIPTGTVTTNAAWIVDQVDDGVHKRYLITDGDCTLVETIEAKSTDPTVFVFELTANAYTILSDNPAYAG